MKGRLGSRIFWLGTLLHPRKISGFLGYQRRRRGEILDIKLAVFATEGIKRKSEDETIRCPIMFREELIVEKKKRYEG